MSRISKTWWGQKFLQTLESNTDAGRLQRGRSYSTDNRIKKWRYSKGVATADMRGNVNPYFGVYKEPTYHLSVGMKTFSEAQWRKVLSVLTERASFISKLLLNEMPENVETAFAQAQLQLLPTNYKEFSVSCSCPDYAVPCKHIAGVFYRLAQLLDEDPFLLFEMRGLSAQQLQQELLKSPLGKVLASVRASDQPSLTPAKSFYTRPKPIALPDSVPLAQYWHGEKALPKQIEPVQEALIPGLVVKKGGDYPAFWDKSGSFITAMEEFYIRMRKTSLKEL